MRKGAILPYYYQSILLIILVCIMKSINAIEVDFDYRGEQACSIKSNSNESIVKGYSDLSILNQDMYLDAIDVIDKEMVQKNEYNYKICPGSVMNIDKATDLSGVDEVIIIYLENTTLSCATNTSTSDANDEEACIIEAGSFQILYTPLLDAKNSILKGITFKSNTMYSITAYGSTSSDATFIDCIWKDNVVAASLVVMYYAPKPRRERFLSVQEDVQPHEHVLSSINSRYLDHIQLIKERDTNNVIIPVSRRTLRYTSMSVAFHQCLFLDNIVTGLIINNQGGLLKLFNTQFRNNIVQFAVVGTVYGGQLSITEDTKFDSNVSPFVTVFVDNDSFLNLNARGNTGALNEGLLCVDGVYLENDDSYCIQGGKCDGECCNFGDDSCDRYAPSDITTTLLDPNNKNEKVDVSSTVSTAEADATNTESSASNTQYTVPKSATMSNTHNHEDSNKVNGLTVAVILLSITLVLLIGLYMYKKKRQQAIVGNNPFSPDEFDNVDPRNDMLNSHSTLSYDDDELEMDVPRDDMLYSQSTLIYDDGKDGVSGTNDQSSVLARSEDAEVI